MHKRKHHIFVLLTFCAENPPVSGLSANEAPIIRKRLPRGFIIMFSAGSVLLFWQRLRTGGGCKLECEGQAKTTVWHAPCLQLVNQLVSQVGECCFSWIIVHGHPRYQHNWPFTDGRVMFEWQFRQSVWMEEFFGEYDTLKLSMDLIPHGKVSYLIMTAWHGHVFRIIDILWWDWESTVRFPSQHDDVIKWKHFPRNWPFLREIHRSPVNFPHKGQWRGALMFSLIYAWINDWANNREAGDLRRQHGHYDVIVMKNQLWVNSMFFVSLAATNFSTNNRIPVDFINYDAHVMSL